MAAQWPPQVQFTQVQLVPHLHLPSFSVPETSITVVWTKLQFVQQNTHHQYLSANFFRRYVYYFDKLSVKTILRIEAIPLSSFNNVKAIAGSLLPAIKPPVVTHKFKIKSIVIIQVNIFKNYLHALALVRAVTVATGVRHIE